MKTIAMLLLLAALPCLADDLADLRRLDRELVVATYTKDASWFTKHMSDDYVLITSGGKLKPRADLVRELGTPGLEFQPYEPAEVDVRLFGDTAVITGRIVQKYTYNGERVEADLRYTDVWVKSPDGWKNVAGHASTISIRKEPLK
jgi:ketosteroid isomerase-like protein